MNNKIMNNMCLCYLKTEQYELCLNFCNQVNNDINYINDSQYNINNTEYNINNTLLIDITE